MTGDHKSKHPILDLLAETKNEQDWQLVTLLGAVSREGSYGQFIKLTFRNDDDDDDFDGERTATCDRVHFDTLLPFIERFKEAEANKHGEEVLIPVYLSPKSNKWKFSPTGAAVLLKDSQCTISEMVIPKNDDSHYQKYEFRYRSNTMIKRKFQEIAENNGLSLNNFLKFIILREIENAEL